MLNVFDSFQKPNTDQSYSNEKSNFRQWYLDILRFTIAEVE